MGRTKDADAESGGGRSSSSRTVNAAASKPPSSSIDHAHAGPPSSPGPPRTSRSRAGQKSPRFSGGSSRPMQLPALRIKDMRKPTAVANSQPQAWSLSHQQLKNSLILVPTPSEEIDFALSKGEPCVGVLMLQNMSRDDHVAFKVKTTKQKRYLVRPAMGIIQAGASLTIQFIVPPAEVEGLLAAGLQSQKSRRKRDKFLVENAVLEKEDLSTQSEMKYIAKMWSLPKWKKKIISKKFYAKHFEAVVVSSDSDETESEDDSDSDAEGRSSSNGGGAHGTSSNGGSRVTAVSAAQGIIRKAVRPTPLRTSVIETGASASLPPARSPWIAAANATGLMPPISPNSRGRGKRFFDVAKEQLSQRGRSRESNRPPMRQRSMSDPHVVNLDILHSAVGQVDGQFSHSSVSSGDDATDMYQAARGRSRSRGSVRTSAGSDLNSGRAHPLHRRASPRAGVRLDPMQPQRHSRSRSQSRGARSPRASRRGIDGSDPQLHRRQPSGENSSDNDLQLVGLSSGGDSDASADTDSEMYTRHRRSESAAATTNSERSTSQRRRRGSRRRTVDGCGLKPLSVEVRNDDGIKIKTGALSARSERSRPFNFDSKEDDAAVDSLRPDSSPAGSLRAPTPDGRRDRHQRNHHARNRSVSRERRRGHSRERGNSREHRRPSRERKQRVPSRERERHGHRPRSRERGTRDGSRDGRRGGMLKLSLDDGAGDSTTSPGADLHAQAHSIIRRGSSGEAPNSIQGPTSPIGKMALRFSHLSIPNAIGGQSPQMPAEDLQKHVCEAPWAWTKGMVIGRGQYGTVYAGTRVDTGEKIAVKEIPIDSAAGSVQSIMREIRVLEAVSHRNIVRYLGKQFLATTTRSRARSGSGGLLERGDQSPSPGLAYTLNIFMEYLAGGSIKGILKRLGAFPMPVVRSFTRQILDGIHHLHQHDIAHRDIKGANILLTLKGILKLADFGSAKVVSETSPRNAGQLIPDGGAKSVEDSKQPTLSSSSISKERQQFIVDAHQKALGEGMDADAATAAALKADQIAHGATDSARKCHDAKDGGGTGSGAGLPLGTPQWMAPEVVRGEVSSLGNDGLLNDGNVSLRVRDSTTWKKADIWSLACTVIEMSSGQPPWHTFSNPMTILFHIAKCNSGPPLDDQLSNDSDAASFMQRCFVLSATDRASARELLQMPFVSEVDPEKDLYSPAELRRAFGRNSESPHPGGLAVLPLGAPKPGTGRSRSRSRSRSRNPAAESREASALPTPQALCIEPSLPFPFLAEASLLRCLRHKFSEEPFPLCISFFEDDLSCVVAVFGSCDAARDREKTNAHGQAVYAGWRKTDSGSTNQWCSFAEQLMQHKSDDGIVAVAQQCLQALELAFEAVLKVQVSPLTEIPPPESESTDDPFTFGAVGDDRDSSKWSEWLLPEPSGGKAGDEIDLDYGLRPRPKMGFDPLSSPTRRSKAKRDEPVPDEETKGVTVTPTAKTHGMFVNDPILQASSQLAVACGLGQQRVSGLLQNGVADIRHTPQVCGSLCNGLKTLSKRRHCALDVEMAPLSAPIVFLASQWLGQVRTCVDAPSSC